jgi:hypothetical protein
LEWTYCRAVSGSCPMQEASKTATRREVMTGRYVRKQRQRTKALFPSTMFGQQCKFRPTEVEVCTVSMHNEGYSASLLVVASYPVRLRLPANTTPKRRWRDGGGTADMRVDCKMVSGVLFERMLDTHYAFARCPQGCASGVARKVGYNSQILKNGGSQCLSQRC